MKNACGITAVVAKAMLHERNIATRLLMLAHPDDEQGHCAVAFEVDGRTMVFDETGTIDLAPGVTLRSPAIEVARAAFGEQTKAAYWFQGRGPARPGKDRRLSPREVKTRTAFAP